jgi:hypothetical protein
MDKIIVLVVTNQIHLPNLITELHAAGFATDVCPERHKPVLGDEDAEYIEVSCATERDWERINALCGVMLHAVDDICKRHGAFCDGFAEPTWWRTSDDATPYALS